MGMKCIPSILRLGFDLKTAGEIMLSLLKVL